MVYSTCSMSPIENEAVVAELIRFSEGQLELIEPREFIPQFKARPGMSSWKVLDDSGYNKHKNNKTKSESNSAIDPEGNIQTSSSSSYSYHIEVKSPLDEVDDSVKACLDLGMRYYPSFEDVPENMRQAFRKSFFSPNKDEQSTLHLERCLRCVPHDEVPTKMK
jgi:hypothetical protein